MFKTLLKLLRGRRTCIQTKHFAAYRPLIEALEDRLAPAASRFAVIGDYGSGFTAEQKVANLVKSWNPDFVVTLGDNIYGPASNYDAFVGQYYHDYIYPYKGSYGAG